MSPFCQCNLHLNFQKIIKTEVLVFQDIFLIDYLILKLAQLNWFKMLRRHFCLMDGCKYTVYFFISINKYVIKETDNI